MIVVDAGLAVKLIIGESDSAAADRWFRESEHDLIAPDLIAIEVAQAVVRRVNDRQASVEMGRAALHRWQELLAGDGIGLIRSPPTQISAAAELAMQLGHPIKDCLYLALAIDRNCGLMTCDAKFAAKARAAFFAVSVF